MREGKEEAREKEKETESPTSIVRLTGRDKELMGHVATARCHAPTTEKDRVRQVAQWKRGRGSERQRGAVGHRLQKTADETMRSPAGVSAATAVPRPRRCMGGGLRNGAA